MPILQAIERQTKKIILPSSTKDDEAWVEVYNDLLVGDIIQIAQLENNPGQATIEILAKVIKDWNFTDKDGNKLPVNVDNVKLLSVKDMIAISQETTAFKQISALPDSKKNP